MAVIETILDRALAGKDISVAESVVLLSASNKTKKSVLD